MRLWTVVLASLLLGSCSSSSKSARVDLSAEIAQIRAIDNHAHPVRVDLDGEAPDRDFDALPVDDMEPSSDPVLLRPGSPRTMEAWRALYGGVFPDAQKRRDQLKRDKGEQWPAWALDQMGTEIMVANRVAMGRGIQPPRFRWAGYVDALMYPLDTSRLASRNSDRKSFFALEFTLLRKYLVGVGLAAPPATLGDYLSRVVTPTLEAHRKGGAIAEKFEAAYLRSLQFDAADRGAAERVYAMYTGKVPPPDDEYKLLQDYLFRFIAAECGRLGMAVHIHTGEGAGSYYSVAGANPLNLEPVLNDPSLRKTNFVMVHGGWPFVREVGALLTKPNAYLDLSVRGLLETPTNIAGYLREWLEFNPEKVLFGTDAYPYLPDMGWEEAGWIAARGARQALAKALEGMVADGEVTRERAIELARMVLRDNARKLYGL